jgi:hypothetical protein
MPITIRVGLTDSNANIEANILRAVRAKLDHAVRGSAPAVKRRLQGLCESMITRTGAYRSLLSGELLGELGIPDVESRLREVLITIQKSVEVNALPTSLRGNRISGGLSVGMLRSSMDDILGLPAASYMSGRHEVPWLSWLVTAGDRIMVFGYDVTFRLSEAARQVSRTGLAIMIPSPGHGWRVPAEFSGTLDSNFLTRAFDGKEVGDLIAKIMRQEIQGRLDA